MSTITYSVREIREIVCQSVGI